MENVKVIWHISLNGDKAPLVAIMSTATCLTLKWKILKKAFNPGSPCDSDARHYYLLQHGYERLYILP